jgi:hypothetical protein
MNDVRRFRERLIRTTWGCPWNGSGAFARCRWAQRVMTVELERLEARFAVAGKASERDLDLYIRAAGNLRRLLEAIGLRRQPSAASSDAHPARHGGDVARR